MEHRPPKQGGINVWTDVPCTTIIRTSLNRHAKSSQHQEAMALATTAKASETTGGIAQALKTKVNLERMAFLAALRAMYWLTKNEVAHTTKFAGLLAMMQGLGVSYLSHLNKVYF